nr:GUN4 domain-containing protein [Argonema antarcticum]
MTVNYNLLNNLLSVRKWKEADIETAAILLRIAGRENELYIGDINNSLAQALAIIDRLWLQHSNGHFGLSTQKHICQSFSRDLNLPLQMELLVEQSSGAYDTISYPNNKKDIILFGLAYGAWLEYASDLGWYSKNSKEWLDYSQLNFNINAPKGHLHARFWLFFADKSPLEEYDVPGRALSDTFCWQRLAVLLCDDQALMDKFLKYNNRCGVFSYEREQYRMAIKYFNECLRIDPQNPSATSWYYNQGLSRLEKEKDQPDGKLPDYEYENAIADFTQALTINPNFSLAYYQRAQCYLKLKKYQQAIEDNARVIRIEPDDGDAYAQRGRLYALIGDTTTDLDKACFNWLRAADLFRSQRDVEKYQTIVAILKQCCWSEDMTESLIKNGTEQLTKKYF